MNDQLPPHNIEAERAALGAMLLNPDVLATITDRLTPDAFFHGAHGTIFAAMQALFRVRRVPDFTTLTDLLEARGKLDQVGVEGVGLVHCVDPVEDHVAVEAVHEEGVLGVHFDGLHCSQQQQGKEGWNQLFHGDLYYSNHITLGNPSDQF